MNSDQTEIINSTTIEQLSVCQLQRMLILNIVIFVVIAPISALSNAGTLFILIKYRSKFKSHHYNILRHTISVSLFQALYLFGNAGLTRIVQTINKSPDNGTVFVCSLRFLPMEITSIVERFSFFILALDRLGAVVYPFYYKTLDTSKKYTVLAITIPWILATLECTVKHLLLTIRKWNGKHLALCLWANTRTDDFLKYVNVESLAVDSVLIIVYISCACVARFKSVTNGTSQEIMGLRLMTACGVDAVVYTCTYLFSNIYSDIIILHASTDDRFVLGPVVFLCMLLSTTPRFLINYIWNRKFRKYVKLLFHCKDNAVVSFTTQNLDRRY